MTTPPGSTAAIILLPPRVGCDACPIRHRAICSMCGGDDLAQLDRMKTYRSYAHGEPIAMTGEKTQFVGSVVAGHVALKQIMPDGRRQMVGLLFASDFLGRPMRHSAPYDAEAVGEVTLCTFERRRFETLLSETPALERRLLEITLDELDAARDWMLLLGQKTAREKVASFLLLVGRRASALGTGRMSDGAVFELPMSREDIAEFLGLTFETVSRQVGALKRDGVIDLPSARRIVVPHVAALLDEAGDGNDEQDERGYRPA